MTTPPGITKSQYNSVLGKVRYAVIKGKLEVPACCPRCGATPPPNKGGARQIQAHHADYSKPLEVEWLCVKCHRAETPVSHQFGETNGLSKLTEPQVREILAAPGSHQSIADYYGVNQTVISDIKRRDAWKHVA